MTTGWVLRTVNRFGEFYLSTAEDTPASQRLQVSIPVAPAGGLFNVRLVKAEGNIPGQATALGGAVGGSSNIDNGDIDPSSSARSYAWLAAVEPRALPAPAETRFTSATFTQQNEVESCIWTINTGNKLAVQWTNGAAPTPAPLTILQGFELLSDGPVSYLALIGNLDAFCTGAFASDCVAPNTGTVTLEFVPAL